MFERRININSWGFADLVFKALYFDESVEKNKYIPNAVSISPPSEVPKGP